MEIRNSWFEEVGGAPNGNRCELLSFSSQHTEALSLLVYTSHAGIVLSARMFIFQV